MADLCRSARRCVSDSVRVRTPARDPGIGRHVNRPDKIPAALAGLAALYVYESQIPAVAAPYDRCYPAFAVGAIAPAISYCITCIRPLGEENLV
jgi:hypothetical protein